MGRKFLHQFLAVISVNIISISFGALEGWPSASLLELQAEDSPIETGPMTHAEAGWVSSTISIGGAVGCIVFNWCANKFGKKSSLMTLNVLILLSWIIKFYADNPFQLCIARFFAGLAGAILTIIPIYVVEISEVRVRGFLGSFLVPLVSFGVLLAFILGNFFSYTNVALICAPLAVIFLFAFSKFPETPQYFIQRENIKAAEMSLRFYRNISSEVAELPEEFVMEFKKLNEQLSVVKTSVKWRDFNNRTARKAMLIGIVLMLMNQLCGALVLLNYTGFIFAQSGASLPPKISAIIVGLIQALGPCISPVFVERAGRKILLTISSIGSGVGLICLGGYFCLTTLDYDMRAFHWVPLTSFSFTIFVQGCGVTSLPFLVISEVMPLKIRNIGSTFCVTLNWLVGFIVIMIFPILSEIVGMHVSFFFFAACCFTHTIFILKYIPETKGKSLDEVLLLL